MFAVLFLLVFCPALTDQAEAQDREDKSWKIEFEGNETFSSMILRDIIATSRPSFTDRLFRRTSDYILRENEIRRDVIRIRRFYERRGFDRVTVQHRIESRDKEWQKIVVFIISEGEPIHITDLDIQFDSSEESEELIRASQEFQRAVARHDFQVGSRYQTVRESDVEGMFIDAMQSSGFAYAEVDFEIEIDTLARGASVKILNRPGPRKTFTSFNVIGDLSVDERIVIRETGIREGDIFSRSKMQTAQRELFNHHLFRFATISIPEAPTDSTLELTIRIREYPQRSLQTSIGFGREEYLRGQVTWQHRNVRQWAHRFSATARASFIEQRVGVEYLVPYLFNTRSSFVSSPYAQHRLEPAFELFRVGFNNSLIYQYSPRLTGSFSYELTYNEELSRGAETSLPDTVLNFNTASFTMTGYYNSGTARTQEGWIVQPTLEISSLFDEASFKYQKTSLDVRRYTELSRNLVIAKRIQGGVIFSADEDSLPSVIRFFSGGTNTVRGWSRQTLGPKAAVLGDDGEFDGYVPIGGNAHFNFNMEFRQNLSSLIRGIGIALFLDGGQVWRSLADLDTRPVQFGAGGGVRYDSPIGPVRVDIGYKLNPTDEDLQRFEGVDYSSGLNPRLGIHFSIGQAF